MNDRNVFATRSVGSTRNLWRAALAFCALALSLAVHAQGVSEEMCGPLTNAYGPFDYTNAADFQLKLPIVEQYHFTQQVEGLKAGQSGSLISDIDYTLRAFPNHHRALWAVAQLERRDPRAVAGFRTVDCYFERAMRFQPRDAVVRNIYGAYLAKRGDKKGALQRYQEALNLAPDSAEIHYNIGLLYIDLGDTQKALEHARLAYSMGYPLPGLRNRLTQLKVWVEPKSSAAK